jgi:hypothetical protein
LGKIQARRDARWISRPNLARRIGWWFLTAMMHLLAPIPILLRVGLILALSFVSVVAITVWNSGCVVSIVLLALVGIGSRFLGIFGLFFLVPLSIAAMIVWLAARWHRRQTLLVDQLVAKEYGRNVLLQALPKLWVVRRCFDSRWHGMAKYVAWQAKHEPEKANLYKLFRDEWQAIPDPLKDKLYQQVMVGFRSLFYYEPVFSDRRDLLAGFRARFVDDKPAAQLLPHITEIGSQMTLDMMSDGRKNGKGE